MQVPRALPGPKIYEAYELLLAATPKFGDFNRGYAVILHDPESRECSWCYSIPKAGTITGYSREVYSDSDRSLRHFENMCKIGTIQVDQVHRFWAIFGYTEPGKSGDFASRFLLNLAYERLFDTYSFYDVQSVLRAPPFTEEGSDVDWGLIEEHEKQSE
ncbi:hypothetical protein BDV12DRAFT_202242 [Aspergillus spectabilis]